MKLRIAFFSLFIFLIVQVSCGNEEYAEDPVIFSDTEDVESFNNPENIPESAESEVSEKVRIEIHSFTPLNEDILNPERGGYDWLNLLEERNDYLKVRQSGSTLGFVKIDLGAYRNRNLPESFLASLDRGFERIRNAGIKVVARFQYDDTQDAPLNIILSHITQLKPVIRKNSDVITVLQAGFIGMWGEWHSSTYGLDNPSARKSILDALLDAVPSSRMIQVRAPRFKVDYLGTNVFLDEGHAYDGSAYARIGHHNDCFLANNTDAGTYLDGAIEWWKNYIENDGKFVAVGGETCGVNLPRSNCDTALEELRRFHWSFIIYRGDAIDAWRAGGCSDEIKKNLGYRFRLNEVSWDSDIETKGILNLEFSVTNEGYASPFNERPVYVILKGNNNCHSAQISADPRFWMGGETVRVSAKLKIPLGLFPGEYSLSLWLPDASPTLRNNPKYAIRFANSNVWDEDTGLNLLSNIPMKEIAVKNDSEVTDADFVPCQ